MKRYATPLILLFALGVIVLGAFLPQLANAWLFPSHSGKVTYVTINDVQLEFDSSDQPQIQEKLAMLLKYNDSMELPDSLASLTREDILRIVQDTVTKYQQASLLPVGLRQVTKREILDAQPYMVSWDLGENQSSIFWNVRVSLTDDANLSLILDDQTGTVCSISFSQISPEAEGTTPLSTAHLQSQMNALCSLFLAELGDAFSQTDPASIAGNAYSPSENALSATLSWSNIMYGEVQLVFFVSANRFSVHLA